MSVTVRFYGAHGRGKTGAADDVPMSVALDVIADGLRSYMEETVAEAKQERLVAAGNISEEAIRNAPDYVGRLRQSIGIRPDGDDVVIHASAPYAKYMEYGTGRYNRSGGGTGRGGWWVPIEDIIQWMRRKGISPRSGESVEGAARAIQRSIRRDGSPGKPFFFPAFEKERQPYIDRIRALFR